MFKVAIICHGLPTSAGPEAAQDITKEFVEHRTWHNRVSCTWDGSNLVFRSENDFDVDGKATLDEFGDAISAYVADPGESSISIQSVEKLP
jgi:hypothetical protein